MVRRATSAVFALALLAGGVGWFNRPGDQRFGLASDVTIPFTLENGHMVLRVRVNDSAPLSLVLDTGDKFAVLDLDRTRAIGLTLGQSVRVRGTSADSSAGAFVSGATYALPDLPGFSRPVTLAIPLKGLAPRLGHDIDGLLGADFISEFVVEVDYERCVLRLHDRDTFQYRGPGESIPLALNDSGFPVVTAVVTPIVRRSDQFLNVTLTPRPLV